MMILETKEEQYTLTTEDKVFVIPVPINIIQIGINNVILNLN